MKKLIVFLAIFLYGDVSEIILKIKEIENLKKTFLNIDYNIFENSKKPIILEAPVIKKKKKKIKLILNAIFNNKVNINGKWYKIGDNVFGFKIVKILDDRVILKKGEKVIVLKIRPNILKVSR